MTTVTPNDRAKSIRNCCVIGCFDGDFVLLVYRIKFSVGIRAFVLPGRTESDLFFFLFT